MMKDIEKLKYNEKDLLDAFDAGRKHAANNIIGKHLCIEWSRTGFERFLRLLNESKKESKYEH